ncbi:hypothetical protein QWY81_17915 [Polaribacter undariae]|uniref:Phage protein D n=1 Tax=Polaribacter sejongensis TaxID=985043 RepID=A0AAJ1QZQ8_9FLAO|nr:hypothetical protein [Polaribacter undariae]MDN3621349.1 hypothetical protein [Polaribacter undariae]UWD31891.1 hypothetical protein NQP51_17380 [Polaribacter undariae]
MLIRVKVQIGNLVFNSVESVERHKSIHKFTETATIKLPKRLKFKSNGAPDSMFEPNKTVKDYIKVNDKVTIWMGYDEHLLKRFEGYVSQGVQPSIPVVIECEDEMFQLKRKEVNVSIENASIKKIIEAIAPGYELDVLDAEIGAFSEKKTTAVKVLQILKKRYGLYSFFIGKKLIVGKPYTNTEVIGLETKTFDFAKNIIKSDLKFKAADDVKLKVKAISINPDNTKLEAEVGDVDGDVRTLHYFDVPNVLELKKLATIDLEKFKVDAYEGTITGFGFPIVEPGQKIRIVDNGYDKRDSTHFVEEITESIDRGYRLKQKIGKQAN